MRRLEKKKRVKNRGLSIYTYDLKVEVKNKKDKNRKITGQNGSINFISSHSGKMFVITVFFF